MSEPQDAPKRRSSGVFARRVALALKQGEFIPKQPGELGLGYELWATHPNGDVIAYCGSNARWYDWFRPVRAGEEPDFTLTIKGTAYRLVRAVDDIPAGFVRSGQVAPVPGDVVRRRGLPTRDPERFVPPPTPLPFTVTAAAPATWTEEAERRHYVVERADGDGWRFVERFKSEWAAVTFARALYEKEQRTWQRACRIVYRAAVLRVFP